MQPEEPVQRASREMGGFLVRLRHSGKETKQDTLSTMGMPSVFEIAGVAKRQFEPGPDTPQPLAVSVSGLVLNEAGVVEPERALDIVATDGTDWRLELAVFSGKHDLTPSFSALIGKAIRVRVEAVTFGVTPFTSLRVRDDDGLVVALGSQLIDPLQDPDLKVEHGTRIELTTGDCGTFTVNALDFAADTRLSLQPAQHGKLRIHGKDYEAWNMASTFVTHDQHCTDLVNDVAWSVQRLPVPN